MPLHIFSHHVFPGWPKILEEHEICQETQQESGGCEVDAFSSGGLDLMGHVAVVYIEMIY